MAISLADFRYKKGVALSNFLGATDPLGAADTQAGPTGFVYLDANYTLTSNKTLTSNWIGSGGVISLGNFNLKGNFTADPSIQMFNINGAGLVTLIKATTSHLYWFGAKADLTSTGGIASMTASSTTLTTSSATFTSSDVGKNIVVQGAGAGALALLATISAFTSSTQVTLSTPASTSVSGQIINFWTTDNSAALNAAVNTQGSDLAYIPYKASITSSSSLLTVTGGIFTSSDVGKNIVVQGAGAGGKNLNTIISAFTSSTQVTVTIPASTSVSNATVSYWSTIGNFGTAEVKLPAGLFYIGSTVIPLDKINLGGTNGYSGSDPEATVIYSGVRNDFCIQLATSQLNVIHDFEIRGVYGSADGSNIGSALNGTLGTPSTGVGPGNSSSDRGLTIERMTFRDFSGYGVQINDSFNAVVRDSRFINCFGAGILLNKVAFAVASTGNTYENLHFSFCGGLTGNAAFEGISGSNQLFLGCIWEDSPSGGLHFSNSSTTASTLVACHFERNHGFGDISAKDLVLIRYSSASSDAGVTTTGNLTQIYDSFVSTPLYNGDITTYTDSSITIASNTNNLTRPAANLLKINCTNASNLTGLTGGVEGVIVKIYNSGVATLTIVNNSSSSTTTNRFFAPVNQVMTPNSVTSWQYFNSRWFLIGSVIY